MALIQRIGRRPISLLLQDWLLSGFPVARAGIGRRRGAGPAGNRRGFELRSRRDGIYFEASPPSSPLGHIPMLTPFTRAQVTIDFLSFATGKVTRVLTMTRHAALGLDVSPDGRTLLFAQSDGFTEDLMFVENFR